MNIHLNKKYMTGLKSIVFMLILTFSSIFGSQIFAQGEIQKEVRVVKPYTPTLSDANKISLLPVFNDTTRINPEYGYTIFPKRFETDYKIDPIKPAKMVGLPIQKLYKTQLSLGAGNYMTPYMELSINQLRAKTTQLGFYFNHQSSTGKIKLENDKKVNAGYNDNLMKLYGKKIFKASVLEADLTGGYNSVLYYGYNSAVDTVLDRKSNMQKILSAKAGMTYYSMHSDSFHLNHKTGLNYEILGDNFKNVEQVVNFSTSINKNINDQNIGGDLSIRYFDLTGGVDSANFSVVDVNPWYAKSSEEWKFLFGVNVNYDGSASQLSFYPKASFEFNIVPGVLVPYLGLNGYREINSYGKMLLENPFIQPGYEVISSNHAMIVFAGLKGRYSNKMSFNLKGSYDKIDSMYFFVNDSSDILRNKFIADYDNMSQLSLSGEVSWHQSEKLQLLFKANYYKFQLDRLKYAWHKPNFEASISADYNLRDKILVGADIFYIGKRYAQAPANTVEQLNGYIDANLGIEYRYTKTLSFFLRFNNLTASKYQVWNQYPVQRFQFLAGFSYSL